MEGIGIDGGTLIVYTICFLIIAVAGYFVWPKLMKALAAKREQIKKTHEDAEAAQKTRENANKDADEFMKLKHQEANKLVDDAKNKAEEVAAGIIAKANTDAAKIKSDAQTEAKEKLDSVLSEARQDIINLSLAAAEQFIGDYYSDPQKSHALIADFFAHIPPETGNMGPGVTVTSAIPLEPDEKQTIIEIIKSPDATFVVDPSILGGIILNGKTRKIDNSIKTKTEHLKTSMH